MSIYRWNEKMTAEDYRGISRQKSQDVEDSFDRSDTDGFLSQWASGISSRVNEALAELAENNGEWTFLVLADLEGNEVHAKPIVTRYGETWAILDDNNNITGEFLAYHPVREKTLAKKGYQEIEKKLPAVVMTWSAPKSYSVNVFHFAEKWLE